MPRRLPVLLVALAMLVGCQPTAARRGATVLFASGADLQSINPLLTLHPLARQVQRYVLFTTLARYDAKLVPRPYLARSWGWSPDRRRLTLRLAPNVPWHDGVPTTARDVRWTLDAARDPAVGYPRAAELAAVERIAAPDDSTVIVDFTAAPARFPDVLTDLAILPAHLLDTVPRARLRQAAWNGAPVGNGPFRFVAHEPNRRWVFAANPDFPAALGGRPKLDRLIVVVVDEPATKLAALTAGELDFAGIQPAHATFVARDSGLAVLSYPLLLTYGVALNTRRPPFDALPARRRLDAAIDRREIVQGYLYGFGTPARGPVPSDLPGYVAMSVESGSRAEPGPPMRFELLTVGSGEAPLEQMVQSQLRGAGIEATIRQLELSAFLARVYGPGHEFEAAVLGVSGDAGLAYLGPLGAVAGISLPADAAAAQRIFADSLPMVALYHARGLQGMNRRVRGVVMDLRGELATVQDWWVAP
ncbi:MAG: ABC transporter substrate-binding protein [Gemmatimonadales bacterium]|nr:ABC transporter substrate-binding protein [Gemmatimonadales bacterium]